MDSMCPQKLWTMLSSVAKSISLQISVLNFFYFATVLGTLFFAPFSLFKVWILKQWVRCVCLFVCIALDFFALSAVLFKAYTEKYLACECCLRQSYGCFFHSLRRVVYVWMGNLLILFKHAINAGNWSLQIGYCEWNFFLPLVPPELNECGTAMKPMPMRVAADDRKWPTEGQWAECGRMRE